MLGKVFSVICIVAVMFGMFCGRGEGLSVAALEGAGDAVKLTVSLCGIMGLWTGVMKVLESAGIIKKFSSALRPFFKFFFPETYKRGDGCDEICANVGANMLGIGNAATALALSALSKMQEANPDRERATDDMITLAVLNTASLSLVPTTILTLRSAAGSSDPFAVVLPIWVTSLASSLFALILTRICAVLSSTVFKRQDRKERLSCMRSLK